MKKRTRNIIIIFSTVLVICISTAVLLYHMAFGPSVNHLIQEDLDIYIYPENTYEDVFSQIDSSIRYKTVFDLLAKYKKYDVSVKPGHYKIPGETNNNELINRLISGNQQPVTVNFNSLRTLEFLSVVLSMQLEPDSAEFDYFFHDTTALHDIGIDPDSIFFFLLPDTYEFYWTATPKEFMLRMKKESSKYWESRKSLAEKKGLSPWEVVTLAAIVEKETLKDDEKATIAGVYLNRLNKNMRLQADPTVVYATGDFSLRRVLKKHTQMDHPYNTYRNYGLPPGPICVPSKASIEAVLNAEDHKYLYFCAKEDMSGYHSFAKTYTQHLINARRFQRELNKRGIK